MFYVSLQIDLTYKIRIGSTVTKTSMLPLVANPGMEPYTEEEKKTKKKQKLAVLSLTHEK